ncbi:MAG: hypothetical protein Q7V57_17910 [Actinomycetota bacterium]|nr:hypothetical protein [Actinomycetota bacterium]
MNKLVPSIVLAAALFASCSDDEPQAASSTLATTTTTADLGPAVDPASVPVYTSAEVCALVSQETAATTLGVEISEVSEVDMSTPQCSYEYTAADGVRSNLTLAVQRPLEDLGGAAGPAGFERATSLVLFDTPYEPLANLGDAAAVSASESLTIIAVLANDQVFTVVTSTPIDLANLVAFATEVAANV